MTENNNQHNVYVTLGASNHSDTERQKDDFYATDPDIVQQLLDIEPFQKYIWEPACGLGHISEVLIANGKFVMSTDLIDRGYGDGGVDFMETKEIVDCDIITNPPYSIAQQFVEHALDIVQDGCKVAMLLRLSFLEGRKRRKLFDTQPPKTVYVSSGRIVCAKDAQFDLYKNSKSAVAHAWFIWEKGYNGDTVIKWFN